MKDYIDAESLKIFKDFIEEKINPEDIAEEEKPIIVKLCKSRKRQLQKRLNIAKKRLSELNNH